MSSFNESVIAQFRATGGCVDGFGDSLVLIHSVGARTGASRVNPALSVQDADAWFVIASAAGAAKHPAWYHNLVAHPEISIQSGARTIEVTAQELNGSAYDDAFATFARVSSAFEPYQDRAGERRLPTVRLTRR